MAGNAPPLVIPIKLDAASALAQLQKLEDKHKETARESKKHTDETTAGFSSATVQAASLMATLGGISALKGMMDQFGQATIASTNELKKMAEDFINLRDRARELAAVVGKKGDVQFTQEQLHFGTETGFADPGAAVDYRTAFQGEANQYQGRFKSPEEFAEFEKAAARLGNQYHVPAATMAKVAGMVVRTGPKEGQTSEEMMKRLGGALSTQMAGSGSISELAGQLGRMSGMVGEGNAFKDVGEAAVATRMAAETNLPEAYTWATEMRTGVLDIATDKDQAHAKALGITAETSNFDAIKKLAKAQSESGENMDVFLGKYFKQKRIKDAFRDSIKAYNNNVMTMGMEDVNSRQAGETEAGTKAFFDDPLQGGKLDTEKARLAEKQGEMGTDKAILAPFLTRAKTELADIENDPKWKMATTMMDYVTRPARSMKGQGYSGFEQMELAQAMRDVRKEAEAQGIDTSMAPSITGGKQSDVEHWLAELVKLTRQMRDQAAAATAPKPLAAPVAKPATR